MMGSIGSIILLVIVVGCIVYWFVLKRQIDDEDGDRIEPHIDSSFSEFSQQELPKNNEQNNSGEYYNDVAEAYSEKFEEKVESPVIEKNESTAQNQFKADEKTSENHDLLEAESNVEIVPKKSFLTRLKETFMGEKEKKTNTTDESLARPASVRTIALILKAPEDQPYFGQEIIDVAEELKLMVGENGHLQQLVTTYQGEEPMYNIAHMISPGSFMREDILSMEIPGILFFAQIPGPDPQMNTAQHLVQAAGVFGSRMGGELLNDQKERVDGQYLKDLIADIGKLEQKEWAKHRSAQ